MSAQNPIIEAEDLPTTTGRAIGEAGDGATGDSGENRDG